MTAPGARILADAGARRRIAEDLDTTLIVEAAAGTGKTTALVARVLACLRTGRARLDGIVCVTFTEKAAGELKLRLRAELDAARRQGDLDPAERSRLETALAQLEIARIGTIHSLCGDLLRERPVEAAIDPSFQVLPEDEAQALLERVFDRWFEDVLRAPPEGVRRLLRRNALGDGPRGALLAACRALVDHRDHPAPWRRDPFDRAGELDAVVAEIASLGALAARARAPRDYLAQALATLAALTERIAERERDGGRDHDWLEAELTRLLREMDWKRRGRGQLYGENLLRADVLARRDALHARLTDVLARADADLAALLHTELQPVVESYQRHKRREGRLDFLDLLLHARDLVAGDRQVRAELQARFTHLFVDEFQDTDPLQAELLLLLAADDPAEHRAGAVRPVAGKLVVVGDPKQAIYRFRRADIALYQRIVEQLLAAGAALVQLSTSFRGVPAVQAAVNRSFAPLMPGTHGAAQAAYVALGAHRPAHDAQPAVVALPVPAPYSRYGKVTKTAVAGSTPDAVAAFVHWLLTASGWTVEDPALGQRVPVAAGHVCLLFRQQTSWGRDVTRPYARALEARRIPHVLFGGRSLHTREEVVALRAALTAIEHPDDSLHVYATLRGPYLALHDEQLLAFREAAGGLRPLRPVQDTTRAAHPEVADALDLLRRLHRQRNRRPIADTIEAFLAATRAHAGVAIWPTGEQALANLTRVIADARRFESRGATSFRSFVDWLDERAARGDGDHGPVVEEGAGGVRLMTAHRAKGLEFPVVILCDVGCARTRTRPSRSIDPARGAAIFPLAGCVPVELRERADEILAADEAEEIRVAYVAATRARDLLVVPTCGDEPVAGWVDVLHPALYPEPGTRRDPRPAPGCPPLGTDSVRFRPPEAPGPDASVAPGLHAIGEGHAVWWDPALLALDAPAIGGVRQQELLIVDEARVQHREGLEAFAAWQQARQTALDAGAVATDPYDTVTALAHAAAIGGAPPARSIAVETTDAARRPRPRGRRFGIVVHAALAAVPLTADADEVARHVALHARQTGAADDEARAAVDAVIAALAHPLLARAAAASTTGDCHRELPMATVRDQRVVEGIADLVWREAGNQARWIVVDFKTDADPGAHLAYRAQLDLYCEMIEEATGEPAEGILLAV